MTAFLAAREAPGRGAGLSAPTGALQAKSLRIGGISPLTSLDYPGELAAVIFCQGCPWRCSYCHNPHLLAPTSPSHIPWSRVDAFLESRQGLLDAVVFSGGEPTMQAALPAAMNRVRALGFKIGLHTAGIYPRRLSSLLPWLDWVGLDIKALPEDYAPLTATPGSGPRAWESLDLLLLAGIPLEVRTTLPPDWRLAQRLEALMHRLATAGVKSFALQTCRSLMDVDAPGESGGGGGGGTFPAPPAPTAFADLGESLFQRFVLR